MYSKLLEMAEEARKNAYAPYSNFTVGAALLAKNGKIYTFCDDTAVYFDTVPADIIQEYADSSEPYDKAGGYAIQGFMGKYIQKIEGEYYNVVGLPLEKLKKLLIFLKIL